MTILPPPPPTNDDPYDLMLLKQFLTKVIMMVFKNHKPLLFIVDGIKLSDGIVQYTQLCSTQFVDFIGFHVYVKNDNDVNILSHIFDNNTFRRLGLQIRKIGGCSTFKVRMCEGLVQDIEYGTVVNFDTYDCDL